MHIKYIDEYTFNIYLQKELINDINFKDSKSIEKYLKELFLKLCDKYNIKVEGFYDVNIYLDKYYGVIISLKNEDIDYFSYYNNQVDMKISVIDSEFLYLVEDIPYEIIDKLKIINDKNNIYLKINEKLNNKEMMKLLEFSKEICNF